MAKEQKQEQTISFHNTPSFYLEYTKNWLAHQRKAKANPAELAIVEDLHKLVEIAVGVLNPVPAEPETEQKQIRWNKRPFRPKRITIFPRSS